MAIKLANSREEEIKSILTTFKAVRRKSLNKLIESYGCERTLNQLLNSGQLTQVSTGYGKVVKRDPTADIRIADLDAFEAYMLLSEESNNEVIAAEAEYPFDYVFSQEENLYRALSYDNRCGQKIAFYNAKKKPASQNYNDNILLIIPAGYSIERLMLPAIGSPYRILLIRQEAGLLNAMLSPLYNNKDN